MIFIYVQKFSYSIHYFKGMATLAPAGVNKGNALLIFHVVGGPPPDGKILYKFKSFQSKIATFSLILAQKAQRLRMCFVYLIQPLKLWISFADVLQNFLGLFKMEEKWQMFPYL